jgi:hypothetical protein
MFTIPALASALVEATKRYAITDADVQKIQPAINAILKAISPGCDSDSEHAGVKPESDRLPDLHHALSSAVELFHRLTDEPRQPDISDANAEHEISHSRKAMRLAYCVKILAEAASGDCTTGTDDRTFAREIHPPRHSPATAAPVPYQLGEAANAIPGADLETVARDIENEIHEMNRLG